MRPLALLVLAHLAALVAAAEAKGGAAGAGLGDDVLGLIVFKADVSDPDGRLVMWSKDDERARLRLGRHHLRRAHLLLLYALPRGDRMP